MACGGSDQPSGYSPLTPMPGKVVDPPDSAINKPLAEFIKKQNAPSHTEWEMVRTDLNGDGRRDAIVMFKLPHHYWCGWDGCGMLVLQAGRDSFTPISSISNVRGPIFISDQKTNNWRDMIVRVSGTNIPDKDIVMAFDGSTYPRTPLLGTDLNVPLSVLNTERFFR